MPGSTIPRSCDETHRSLVKGLIDDAAWSRIGARYQLSDRELAVARFLTLDLNRDQIALLLKKSDGSSLSGDTVRVYMDRLFRKLSVSSRVQFVTRMIFDSLPTVGHKFGDFD